MEKLECFYVSKVPCRYCSLYVLSTHQFYLGYYYLTLYGSILLYKLQSLRNNVVFNNAQPPIREIFTRLHTSAFTRRKVGVLPCESPHRRGTRLLICGTSLDYSKKDGLLLGLMLSSRTTSFVWPVLQNIATGYLRKVQEVFHLFVTSCRG